MSEHYLTRFFEPNSIALFGASSRPESLGSVVFNNLLNSQFKGQFYPINPEQGFIRDIPCFPRLEALDKSVDLAVITSPAPRVPDIVKSCGQMGVKAAIILSTGFREASSEGQRLENAVLDNARRYGLRFIGPSCLGLMRPDHGLNASFNRSAVKSGKLALVSQSGALCTAIVDWASGAGIGFSSVVSLGVSADIDFGELLDYLVCDPKTHAILLYIEIIKNARAFMSGLRAAARAKPVIIVKAGRHRLDSSVTHSHSGSLVCADDVFDAASRRAGVVRSMRVGDLFAAAAVLADGQRAKGENLVIITNGGGLATMACDRASDLGLPLARLAQNTLDRLNEVLPSMWSQNNPVDILGDADAERYSLALEICLCDEGVDGALVMLTPQPVNSPIRVAKRITEVSRQSSKPVITCWMGDRQVQSSRRHFAERGIPSFVLPEMAVQGYAYLTNFYRNQQLLLQTPEPVSRLDAPDTEGARLIIERALSEKRTILTEIESKALLSAFHIPITAISVARDAGEALIQAETLGFPVVMKIYSKQISYKTDVDGVRLGLSNAAAVQHAFFELVDTARRNRPDAVIEGVVVESMACSPHGRELMVGIARDPVFGPVICFGTGGTKVELIRDRAVALPPLNSLLIDDLISHTQAAHLLEPFRHMPAANMDAIEQVLLHVSEMACELPWIRELDINPLIADEHGVLAVDARVVVEHSAEPRRYAHMAIHPYPSDLTTNVSLPQGIEMTIRPVRPEDAAIEHAFVHNLSERAKYFRFLHYLKDLSPEMLARFTQIDYDREMALIAVVQLDGAETEIGVSRYTINADGKSCEFAVAVADDWQHCGIAHKLMEQLIECARYRGLKTMQGEVLADNTEMQVLAKSLGFSSRVCPEDPGLIQIFKPL